MILKKILCTACAALTAVSCLAFSASADAEEKKTIPFTFDKLLTVTDSEEPTLSFDGDDWSKYVHTTPDASKVGLTITLDKTTFYQGFSLRANCSGAQESELFLNAGTVRDSDNNLVFPDAEKEDASFITPGVELRCEDFGLSCFDGCFITFYYKIGSDCKDKLMGDSVYVFGTDESYAKPYGLTTLKYDTVLNNNVTQYREQGVSIPSNSACTRVIFETPLLKNTDCDVLCLDNIKIQLPESAGTNLTIKNLDGYNSNAKPQDIDNLIRAGEKKESAAEIGSTPEKQEGGHGFIVVIVIVVVALGAGVGGFFFIRKKKKYY